MKNKRLSNRSLLLYYPLIILWAVILGYLLIQQNVKKSKMDQFNEIVIQEAFPIKVVLFAFTLIIVGSVILLGVLKFKKKINKHYLSVFFPICTITVIAINLFLWNRFNLLLNYPIKRIDNSTLHSATFQVNIDGYRARFNTPLKFGVYSFLEYYSKDKTIISYSASNSFLFYVSDFLSSKIKVLRYDPNISNETLSSTIETYPHYITGHPQINLTVFIMGEVYERSKEIYLFKVRNSKIYLLVPAGLIINKE